MIDIFSEVKPPGGNEYLKKANQKASVISSSGAPSKFYGNGQKDDFTVSR